MIPRPFPDELQIASCTIYGEGTFEGNIEDFIRFRGCHCKIYGTLNTSAVATHIASQRLSADAFAGDQYEEECGAKSGVDVSISYYGKHTVVDMSLRGAQRRSNLDSLQCKRLLPFALNGSSRLY